MAVFEINQGGGGDFTTIAAFEASAAYGDVGQITDAGGTTYTENVTWSGASGTPSSGNDIRLEATNEHLGVFGAGIIHRSTSGHVNTISEDWLHFLGIEFLQDGTGASDECFRVNAVDGILIERAIVRASSVTSDQDGIYTGDTDVGTTAPLVLVNCILKGFARAGLHLQSFGTTAREQNAKAHFCTFDGNGDTSENEGGGINSRVRASSDVNNIEVYNCIAARTTDNPDYSELIDPNGTNNWSGTNNACSDTSLTSIGLTTGAIENSDITVELTDPDTNDYSLAASSAYEGAGTDRTASSPDSRADLTVDIAGTTRPGTPSIGAFDTAAAGGTTVEVGLASETDTANSVTVLKTYPMGLATETDTALAIQPQRSYELGLASETDAALATTTEKSITAGVALESDVALPATAERAYELGLAEETDAALAAQADRAYALGLATEADTALAVTPEKTVVSGLAQESDAALAVTVVRTSQLGLAEETDTAFDAAAVKGNTIAVGLAQETDTAFSVVPERVYTLGLAQESDLAFAVTPERAYSLGLATETDEAFAATAVRTVTVGLAAEINEAFAVLAERAYALGLAQETDEALPVVVDQGQTVQVGLALETDTAFGVTRAKSIIVGRALETDTALSVTILGGEQPEEGAVFEGPHLVNVSRLMRSH